jgi:hypothetical protein
MRYWNCPINRSTIVRVILITEINGFSTLTKSQRYIAVFSQKYWEKHQRKLGKERYVSMKIYRASNQFHRKWHIPLVNSTWNLYFQGLWTTPCILLWCFLVQFRLSRTMRRYYYSFCWLLQCRGKWKKKWNITNCTLSLTKQVIQTNGRSTCN